VSELTDIFPSTPVLKNNTKIAKASRAVLYSNLNTTLRKFNRSYRLQTVHKGDTEVRGDGVRFTVCIGHIVTLIGRKLEQFKTSRALKILSLVTTLTDQIILQFSLSQISF